MLLIYFISHCNNKNRHPFASWCTRLPEAQFLIYLSLLYTRSSLHGVSWCQNDMLVNFEIMTDVAHLPEEWTWRFKFFASCMHACTFLAHFQHFEVDIFHKWLLTSFVFGKIITVKLNWLSSTYSIGRTVSYEVPMFSTPVTYIALWHWYTWCIRTTPFHIPVKIETG